jgi:lipoate-protein ligase B
MVLLTHWGKPIFMSGLGDYYWHCPGMLICFACLFIKNKKKKIKNKKLIVQIRIEKKVAM